MPVVAFLAPPAFEAMQYACCTSMGHGISFQREFFVMLVPLRIRPA
jgi:hypothetical protein